MNDKIHKTEAEANTQAQAIIDALNEREVGCVGRRDGSLIVDPFDATADLEVSFGVGRSGTGWTVGSSTWRPSDGAASYDGGSIDADEDPGVTADRLLAQARSASLRLAREVR